jgi:hypothetical protein
VNTGLEKPTITSHGSQVTTLLQHFDDLVLVLGENFSESICPLNKIVLSCTRKTTMNEFLRIVDLCAECQHLASFLSNGNGITSQHLDWDTELLGFDDRLGGIFARRIEHRQETAKRQALVDISKQVVQRTDCD